MVENDIPLQATTSLVQSDDLTVRSATPSDFPAILAIYTPYVLSTAITFDLTPPSLEAYSAKLSAQIAKHAVLVAVLSGTVVGYAYASPFNERHAYQWSCTTGLYLSLATATAASSEGSPEEPETPGVAVHGRGIGGKLYQALMDRLRERGFRNAFALIALPNDRSIALHKKIGFEEVGVCKRVGWKLGKWWDVGYWQLDLGGGSGEAAPLQ